MRPPKSLTVIVLVLMLVQTTGCYSYRPLRRELPSAWSPGEKARFVDVELKNGESIKLMRASRDSSAVRGETMPGVNEGDPQQVTIPASAVADIQERHFSVGKLALGTLGIAVVLGGLMAVALSQVHFGISGGSGW